MSDSSLGHQDLNSEPSALNSKPIMLHTEIELEDKVEGSSVWQGGEEGGQASGGGRRQ